MLPQTTGTDNIYNSWTDGFREVMAELSDPNANDDPMNWPWWTDQETWELTEPNANEPPPAYEPTPEDWAEAAAMFDAIERKLYEETFRANTIRPL